MDQRPTPIAQPSVIPSDSNDASLDNQNEWKTYTPGDEVLVPKFQIKYPDNWEYKEVSAGTPLILDFYTEQSLHAPIKVQVEIGEIERPVTEEVVINGLKTKKIILEHWEIIEFKKENYVFSVMKQLKDSQTRDNSLSAEEETEIFNEMVSSFQFVN